MYCWWNLITAGVSGAFRWQLSQRGIILFILLFHPAVLFFYDPFATLIMWSGQLSTWATEKQFFLSNNELRNDPNILYQVKHLIYFNAVHASSVSHFIWIEKAKTFEPPRFSFYLLATLRCLLLILLHTCSFSWSQVQWVGSSLTSYIHYLYELGKRGEIETQNV